MGEELSTGSLARRIFMIRGRRIMLGVDLAVLYGVETRALNQAVRRNIDRFPDDFMFKLTREEIRNISQIVICSKSRTKIKHSPSILAFTEHGVAMLSSVLRGPKAVQVNIQIMRTFGKLREIIAADKDLARRLDSLEKKYDAQFKVVFDAIRELTTPAPIPRKRIGFDR
ncbi:MAG: ORF6N domain-containing protein [Elusimicrobiota bacterium]